MGDSATITSLQQLLARSSAPSSSSRSSPRRSTTSSPAPTAAEGAAAGQTRAGWGATLSSAFGYGLGGSGASADASSTVRSPCAPPATVAGAAGSAGKGSERGRIPVWTNRGEAGRNEGQGDTPRRLGPGARNANDTREQALDDLDELAQSILWQAGEDHVDPSGPLLVLACCRIPPPSEVSHPDLLERLRTRLEAYAQTGPYSLVALVNPTPHAPASKHLVSAYLSLSRAARKNVRAVHIVGGGWWTKVLITLFSSFLSTKTARKLIQSATLSELAESLGAKTFVQIEFPLDVYSAHAASEKEIALPDDAELPGVFGVELAELLCENRSRLPAVVQDCLNVLLEEGPSSVGIFRRSPSAAHVAILHGAYSRGHPVSLSKYPDAPYLAASLLKRFLHDLPTPIFPRSSWDAARTCPIDDDEGAVAYLREHFLPLLDPPALALLQRLTEVLSRIAARADENLMTSSNLVVCLCPALIGGVGASFDEIEMCRVRGMEVGSMRGMQQDRREKEKARGNTLGGVLRMLIDRHDEVFAASARSPVHSTQQADATTSSRVPSPLASPVAFASSPSSPTPAVSSPSAPASPAPCTSSRMARSTSLSSIASSTHSFASAASHSSRASGRSTLKLKKAAGGPAAGRGTLVEAFREDGEDEPVLGVEKVTIEGVMGGTTAPAEGGPGE
ncbi:uncharacterized protein JCM10292_000852 [Rhodotorula paludigena]|uniref:uncharacterized protein n=1 Tax=Rhodotorula paludigena TaxID=86838 RepID=UPI00317B73C9